MDDSRDPVRLGRTASPDRSLGILVGVGLAFLGLAILRPWDFGRPPPVAPTARPGPSAIAAVSAGPTSAPSSPGRSWQCYYAGGWRAFALAENEPVAAASASAPEFASPTRTWFQIDPATKATDPSDRRIPTVLVVTRGLAALGYCAPPGDEDRPPSDAAVQAWRVGTAREAPVPLDLQPVRPPEAGPGDGSEALFAPAAAVSGTGSPSASAAVIGRWPVGRYVFAIRSPSDPSYERWYGIEVRPPL
ncbi:MAG: hypothetical protein ACJ761_09945 [Chloroflexota bacterium]